MHHRLTFSLGLGGFGIFGRMAIAIIILLFLKHFDKQNPQYAKAIKTILIGCGRVACFAVFAVGLLWGTALLPFWFMG